AFVARVVSAKVMLRTLGPSLLALAVVALGAVALGACGTDAVAVDTCRQIESARCKQAPNCPQMSLANPVHIGADVDPCIRSYDDACLHGLVAGADPGATALKACLDAINTGDCPTVVAPETNPACGFLNPAPPVDAGVDAPEAAAEAAADAPTE